MKLNKISQVELDEILKQHQKWLDSGYNKGHQADLSYTDLNGMDLKGVNLEKANLEGANLHGNNLYGSNLEGADLWNANLENADLSNSNLWGANLNSVNLSNADLENADLSDANLWGANLRFADLQEAKLNWVNWHEVKNIKVYVAGLQSSREKAQLTYIPSIDVATTGFWQGTWKETIKKIHSVYAEDTRERKAYDLAIESIQEQMDLDDKGI